MEAFSDDVLGCILRNNVGISTFVQVSSVCKRLRRICHTDESILISAATYSGGLTRTDFKGLFALTPSESEIFTHVWLKKMWHTGRYCIYHADGVNEVIRAMGGMVGWRERVAASLLRPAPKWSWPQRPAPYLGKRTRRLRWELEEDLHEQSKHSDVPIGYSALDSDGLTPVLLKRQRIGG